MRSQFLQSPGLSPYGRRGSVAATSAYAINGLTPATIADYQAETYAVNGAPVTLSEVMTFARSGTALAPGSDGYLDSFASGAIRAPSYMLDDGSWVRGLTLETKARTNVIGQSNISAWTPQLVTVTGGVTGVDGLASAYKLQDNGGGGGGNCRVQRNMTVAAATKYTWSWYAKEDQLHWLMAYVDQFTTPPNTLNYFDAGTGVAGLSTNNLARGIEDAGNGWYRCWVTFTTHATDLAGILSIWLSDGEGDFTVDRDGTSSILIDRVQFEVGALPSSHIAATAGTNVTRNAESLSIASGDWPYSATAMSGVLIGAETYADEGVSGQVFLVDIRANTNNRITLSINTDGAKTGTVTLTVVNGGAAVSVSAAAELTPGILSGFGIAWRVTGSEINIALDGVAAAAVANTAGIPDLSAQSVNFGGMGFRKQALFWGDDIGDAGLEEASAPGHFNIEVV